MSRENVELVRSIYAEWQEGDYSSTEWQLPEIEFVMADGPNPGSWVGARGITQGWGDFLSVWHDFRHAADEYRDLDGERVLVFFHFTGRGKASGLDVDQMPNSAAGLFHVRDGRVTRIVLHFDRSAALEAVGLSE
jgi:ketosteroid isomerase-like protein